MTREEAISVIQEVFDNAELSHCGHYATALDMAIEALNAPQTDLISRADAIEAVEIKIKWFNGDSIEDRCKRDAFIQVIDDVLTALPSADAEPKRVLQGYCKGANTIQTIRHEELKQIANTRKAVESADAVPQMEHDREWIIGCIKHDGFIKTDRFDKANQIILEALSADAVQGEWQKVEEQPYFRKHYDTVCCSICRKKGNRKWNFCPNCGARMKGGAE